MATQVQHGSLSYQEQNRIGSKRRSRESVKGLHFIAIRMGSCDLCHQWVTKFDAACSGANSFVAYTTSGVFEGAGGKGCRRRSCLVGATGGGISGSGAPAHAVIPSPIPIQMKRIFHPEHIASPVYVPAEVTHPTRFVFGERTTFDSREILLEFSSVRGSCHRDIDMRV